MPYIPYLPNIPYFPNMPYQTDHTHHTYPTYHTTPPPHHRGGRGTAPHRHHTTGGEGEDLIWGQYMGPIPWGVGGGGGWQGLVHVYVYIYIYCIYIYIYIHIIHIFIHLKSTPSKSRLAVAEFFVCSELRRSPLPGPPPVQDPDFKGTFPVFYGNLSPLTLW